METGSIPLNPKVEYKEAGPEARDGFTVLLRWGTSHLQGGEDDSLEEAGGRKLGEGEKIRTGSPCLSILLYWGGFLAFRHVGC